MLQSGTNFAVCYHLILDVFMTDASAESIDDDVDYGRNIRRRVRLAGTTLYILEPRSEQSCKFVTVQYLDAGGQIPVWVVNQKLPESLSVAKSLREEFSRDEEVDEIEREKMAAPMEWNESVSEDEEVRGASLATR